MPVEASSGLHNVHAHRLYSSCSANNNINNNTPLAVKFVKL